MEFQNYQKAYILKFVYRYCVSQKMEIRKLSKNEIEQLKNEISHGGRKAKYDEILQNMNIGDWIEIENINRGVISRASKRLGMKFSVHYINGKYYIERTE